MNNNKQLAIFRRLTRKGAQLIATQRSADGNEPWASYALAMGDERSDPKLTVADDELRAWLADGLIERYEAGYRLSREGVFWLKRQLSTGQEFQSQHQKRAARVIDFEGAKRPAIVNEAESPLAWLANRKDKNGVALLAPFQFQAGERLRSDYQFAGLTARVTASWNPVRSSGSNGGSGHDMAALQDNVMAARQRVVRALASVGPELAGVLVDVCCHLKGLEEAEKLEGWPQRSGKIVLQIALTRLARHYGLISDGQIAAGLKRKLEHWGADDYRPKLGGGNAGS